MGKKFEFVYDSYLGDYIDECMDHIKSGESILNQWETDFIESVSTYWTTYDRLTTDQAMKLEQIWKRATQV